LPKPLVAIAVLAVCPLVASSAAAAPGWTAPAAIGDAGAPNPTFFANPAVGLAPDGTAVVAWGSFGGDSSSRPGGERGTVLAAVHGPGGDWQPAQPLDGSYPASVRVGLDASARATVAWSVSEDPFHTSVRQATRAPGGPWAPGTELVDAFGLTGFDAAVGADGTAVVAWAQAVPSAGGDIVDAIEAQVRPPGGDWSGPGELAQADTISSPSVAVDPSGGALSGWNGRDAVDQRVGTAGRAPGGPWGAPAPAAMASDPQFAAFGTVEVGLDAAGDATALWTEPGRTGTLIRAARRPASGGVWSGPVTVATLAGVTGALAVHLAVGNEDTAYAAWLAPGGRVTVSIRPPGGPWGAPRPLGAAGAREPAVAAGPSGQAALVWPDSTGVVQAAVRPVGGDWTTAKALSQPGANLAQVAFDAAGDAMVAWSRTDRTTEVVEAAAYDASGPHLSGIAGSDQPIVGRSTAFSVGVSDPWSPVSGVPTWDFGDGTTAQGAGVSHTYAAPGAYTITVQAIDALGNRTGIQRQVIVTPATPAPSLGSAGVAGVATAARVRVPRVRMRVVPSRKRGGRRAILVSLDHAVPGLRVALQRRLHGRFRNVGRMTTMRTRTARILLPAGGSAFRVRVAFRLGGRLHTTTTIRVPGR
jgi:hypothetical protein